MYVRVTAGMCVTGVKCLPEYIYIFHFILKILRGKGGSDLSRGMRVPPHL